MDEYIKFKYPVAGHVDMNAYLEWYRGHTGQRPLASHGNVIVTEYDDTEGGRYTCEWQHSSVGALVPSRFVTLFAIPESEDE